ncbi:exodeoxyribonuclease VII small subunit [Alteromonas lipolytica]|uniref:Exodeoxyribonuclease 7 small subunit n=1 Tax=Alteromonas lipolytica TaxID=1856405 RepID=A0A1E8F995_9ALTE|nr:exodeoxyribonuclease VII small subunit [Alteromonas lipolytica]OFI32491.1 exodeoxyribonuclease VII small subunit [Alteromonas lipolytica]
MRPKEGSVSDKATPANPSFEQTISELEAIVNEMEQGDLPLHEALQKFERGIELSRLSQKALVEAEQKVRILTEQNGDSQLQDFAADNED